MKFYRRRLHSFAWVALFAMCGLALAPTVSHALASSGAPGGFNPWAEICSAAAGKPGAVVAVAHAVDAPAPQAHTPQLDHCPLCGHGGAASPALPPSAMPLPAPDGADFVPALFAHAPRPLFAWAASQPRGPPAVS